MRTATLSADFAAALGPLDMSRVGQGQGGLSSEPMWASRVAEVRALRPRLIRFWIQEYFRVLPAAGEYAFAQLDAALEPLLRTGATPLVSLNLKPRALFPTIDERNLTPNDWRQWEALIGAIVGHYVAAGRRGWYWEIGGESDQGEGGGCPYLADATTYIPFYEHTAKAVLRADPTARVGGAGFCHLERPDLAAWLDWCVSAAAPLHFVSWHWYGNDPLSCRKTIEHVRGLLAARPSLTRETILDEWSAGFSDRKVLVGEPRFLPCLVPEVIWHMMDAGLDQSCYYHIRDYHVNIDEFMPFFTPHGAAFMARWWNRMPQAGGLFDFQDTPRPAYFAFKLLARLTGTRLRAESSDPLVHALCSHDEAFGLRNLMFWNFSDEPVELAMTLENTPADQELMEFALDALTQSNDENHRIRLDASSPLDAGRQPFRRTLAPYAVHLWCLHGRTWGIEG